MWWLLACVAEEACPSGSARADDGRCYAETTTDADPTYDDVVASLPACEPSEGDGRFEPDRLCADGVCFGDAYSTVVATLGPETDCSGRTSADDPIVFMFCEWPTGLWGGFPAVPDESDPLGYRPDPDAPTTWPLWFDADYTGTSVGGLGVDTPLACWLDALGPASLSVEGVDELQVRMAWWPHGLQLFPDDEAMWQVIYRGPR